VASSTDPSLIKRAIQPQKYAIQPPESPLAAFLLHTKPPFYILWSTFNQSKRSILMLSTQSEKMDPRYFVYHRDGWQDLFIGLGILMAGAFVFGDLAWMPAIFIPVLLPTWQAARKRFLDRRLNPEEIPPQDAARGKQAIFYTTILLGLLVLAGLGAFFLFARTSNQGMTWMRQYFMLLLGGLFGGTWLYFAFTLRLPRFGFYGLLTFGILTAVQFTGLHFGLALITLGAAILLTGLFVLVRFMQEHPVLEQ
jgi:hypothetical protein